jgi:hypothetical protein
MDVFLVKPSGKKYTDGLLKPSLKIRTVFLKPAINSLDGFKKPSEIY